MKLVVAAVGHRMPAWVDDGFAEYAKRMPREAPLELLAVKAEPRNSGKPVEALMAAEAERLRAALPGQCRRVVLDEHGEDITTMSPSSSAAPTAWTPVSRRAPTKRCACRR
jgi:23S rRNA (pseudouridine1915-N3)-methyltransferase